MIKPYREEEKPEVPEPPKEENKPDSGDRPGNQGSTSTGGGDFSESDALHFASIKPQTDKESDTSEVLPGNRLTEDDRKEAKRKRKLIPQRQVQTTNIWKMPSMLLTNLDFSSKDSSKRMAQRNALAENR